VSATRSLFGFHAVTARLRQHAQSIEALYVDDARNDVRMRDLAARARAANVAVHPVGAARLAALSGHAAHQGVVAIVDAARPHVTLDDMLDDLAEPALLLVLDGVTDPHNLGACLRVADAAGVHAVVAPKASAERRHAPRLCGSVTPSRMSRRAGSSRSASTSSRVTCGRAASTIATTPWCAA